jgi:hypothetical protein
MPNLPELDRVRGPAVALLVVGALNVAIASFGAVVSMTMGGPLMLARKFAAGHAHDFAPAWVSFLPIFAGAGIWVSLAVGGLTIGAAIAMQRLQLRRLAIFVSVLTMLCSPSNILGIAAGIWALIILTRKEVVAAFDKVASGQLALAPAGPVGKSKSSKTVWIVLLILGLLLIVPAGLIMGWYFLSSHGSHPSTPVMGSSHGQPSEIHSLLIKAAQDVLKEHEYRFSQGGIQLVMDKSQESAHITINNLGDKQAQPGTKVEGGFNAICQHNGVWLLTGWGALEGLEGRLNTGQ